MISFHMQTLGLGHGPVCVGPEPGSCSVLVWLGLGRDLGLASLSSYLDLILGLSGRMAWIGLSSWVMDLFGPASHCFI